MFLQLVTPPPFGPPVTSVVQANADSLFLYHPLQLSAIVEMFWRNRYNALNGPGLANSPFVAWPVGTTQALLSDDYRLGYNPPGVANDQPPTPITTGQLFMPAGEIFVAPLDQPGLKAVPGMTNFDHLIYAYLIENTRIYDIFAKVLETYMFSEQLPSPSFAAQQFLRNTEYLVYSDALPTMVWTTASRLRSDEIANRMTLYYWMFGIDLSHAPELSAHHPYPRPEAANRDFIPTFEALASEVWKGIENAKNSSGANPTDNEAMATAARRIYDMMATRQLNDFNGNVRYRAVSIMAWLHLAVLYDSAIVLALNASASSPEQRLQKIAERVGMSAHSKSKALFDLAQPFSSLMQSIETGLLNDPGSVVSLYTPPSTIAANAEIVIDQYSLASGRDLKASAMTMTPRAATAPRPAPHVLPPATAASHAASAHAPHAAAHALPAATAHHAAARPAPRPNGHAPQG